MQPKSGPLDVASHSLLMWNFHLPFALIILAFLSCNRTVPTDADQTSHSSQILWADEFEGTGAPDARIWSFDIGNGCPDLCGWGNREMQSYTNALANVEQKNGSLHIRAVRQPDGSWSSARIKTLGKQRIQYGKVVARAKLPSGTGTWPAIWMLGERIAESGWPACGEIDIVEHVGKAQGSVHSSIHSISSFGMTRNTGDTIVADCSENFHDYSVEWSDTEITFAVDDQPFYTYRPTVRNNETWPFDAPFFLIANIAVGGNWGSEETLETQGKKDGIDPELTAATMEIDYIRVYELSSIAHSN